jgi:hypothetical protein
MSAKLTSSPAASQNKIQDGLSTPRGRRPLAFLFVLIPALLLAVPLWKPWIHGNDGAKHYAYCRSFWLDGDFDFTNEFQYYMEAGELEKTPIDPVTDLPSNSQGIGAAVLWSPFFLVGHCVAKLSSHPDDGYSPPYVWAVSAGTALYAMTGLVLLFQALRRRYGLAPSLLSLYSVWLGSPLLFYMYLHPSMSHGCSFFLCALMVWLIGRWNGPGRWWHSLVVGLVAGLAIATRINNAVFLPALFAFVCGNCAVGDGMLDRRKARAIAWAAFLTGVGVLIGLFPQLLAWKAFHGAWFSGPRGYNLESNIRVFASPHFFDILFSGWRGLFVWSPALIPGFVGLVMLLRGRRLLDWSLLIAFLAQTWVIGGWAYWQGGASFGQRFFINFLPALALGLAHLYSTLGNKLARRALAIFLAHSIVWSGGLLVQYATRIIDREAMVLTRELARNQFTRVPRKILESARLLKPSARIEAERDPDSNGTQTEPTQFRETP